QGEIESYLVPRSLGTFNKRHPYFHEGLSLQEAVTPLIEIDLGNEETEIRAVLDVQLRYRGEASGTVTTRRPVLDVSVFGGELFASEVSFRLEARAKVGDQETVVGEAASCAHVDPATGVVKLKAGQAVKVPLRVAEDFTGAMEVRAVDAETGLTYGAPLKLKTEILT
ncbi:MAG: PglZ domain-containing protein, partial [Verrucomicrobia bacterium]|nr:PglZ domain-containing protein [Verrucomicrobiota bacterium]